MAQSIESQRNSWTKGAWVSAFLLVTGLLVGIVGSAIGTYDGIWQRANGTVQLVDHVPEYVRTIVLALTVGAVMTVLAAALFALCFVKLKNVKRSASAA